MAPKSSNLQIIFHTPAKIKYANELKTVYFYVELTCNCDYMKYTLNEHKTVLNTMFDFINFFKHKILRKIYFDR